MASLIRLGDTYINLDAVRSIHANVRAQRPDRKLPADQRYVNDAVCLRFGSNDLTDHLHLFDDEAKAFLAAIDKDAKSVVVKAPEPPRAPDKPAAPTPAPTPTATAGK